MPTKKQSVFDVVGKEPAKAKLPTLRQYIKENPDAKYSLLSRIELIWFPGTWDNYSIETSILRCSIGTNHPLYKPLDESIIAITEKSDTGIILSVEDKEGTIRLCESNVYGKWERIGNAGIRFKETPGAN